MQQPSLSDQPATRIGSLFRNLAAPTRDPDNAEFLRGLLLLGGALFVLTLIAYLCTTSWTWPFPRDKATLVVGRDFLNLWMQGRAIGDADPMRFYDIFTYNDELAKMLGAGYPGQNWPNPATAGRRRRHCRPNSFLQYFHQKGRVGKIGGGGFPRQDLANPADGAGRHGAVRA